MKRFLTNAMGVASLTITSQILGYVREMIFAYYLGTTMGLEAFQVAETVPLLFTQILISAVPLALTPLLVREQEEKKDGLVHSAIVLWGVILIALSAVILIFPNVFVKLVAPGFQGEKYILTCRLVIILVPDVFFLSMVAVLNAFLNSKKQFLIPAATALLLNASIIIMQIATRADVFYVAVGSVVGGILMFAITLLCCIFKYKFRLNIGIVNIGSMKTIVMAIMPVCVISSFSSINLMLDKLFASQLGNGAVAILSYSYKIINLPVYLFVTSVAKVMLPDITMLLTEKKEDKLSRLIWRVVFFCLIGGIFAIIGIQVLGNWLVNLLFGRGAFASADVINTADSLKVFSFGIAGMALSSFFQSVSYAKGKYYEPLKVLIIQLVVYLSVVLITLESLGINAIILGNVVAINVAIIIWFIILKRNYHITMRKGKSNGKIS